MDHPTIEEVVAELESGNRKAAIEEAFRILVRQPFAKGKRGIEDRNLYILFIESIKELRFRAEYTLWLAGHSDLCSVAAARESLASCAEALHAVATVVGSGSALAGYELIRPDRVENSSDISTWAEALLAFSNEIITRYE